MCSRGALQKLRRLLRQLQPGSETLYPSPLFSVQPVVQPCSSTQQPAALGLRALHASAPVWHDAPSVSASERSTASSIYAKEARKFAELAGQWWDPEGPFAPLHRLNPTRVKFIRDTSCAVLGLDPLKGEPLQGLNVLDVGCGGGILSESLARLGARVHGIDITEQNVGVARAHAAQDPVVLSRIRYQCTPLEALTPESQAEPTSQQPSQAGVDPCIGSSQPHITSETGSLGQQQQQQRQDNQCDMHQQQHSSQGIQSEQQPEQLQNHRHRHASSPPQTGQMYDVVIASEVVEHVRRPDRFCVSLASVLRPGGLLVISTLNRTPASWAVAIVGAEYISRAVPRGTHDWSRFITPQELYLMAKEAGLNLVHAAGMTIAPSQPGGFMLTEDLSVNYIAAFHKPLEPSALV